MKTLQVRVVSPQGEVFNGAALSVSSKNTAGKFDVLPEHANFVTLIEDEPIVIIKSDKQKAEFRYDLAILHAGLGKVDVYTDIPKIKEG